MFLVPRKQICTSQPQSSNNIDLDNKFSRNLLLALECNGSFYNSVTGNLAQSNGDAGFIACSKGKIASLNGTSQYISVATSDFSPPVSGDWTYAWSAVHNSSGTEPFISAWDNSSSGRNLYIYITAGQMYVDVPWKQAVFSVSPRTAGVLFRYHLTKVGTALTLYCDGAAIGSGTLTVSLELPTTAILFGKLSGGSEYLNGQMGGIRVWSVGLTSSEVIEEFENPSQIFKKNNSSIYIPTSVSSGTAYTTTLSGGSYTYSGSVANLSLTRGSESYSLSLAGSSYSLAGTTLISSFTRNLVLEGAVYSSTGSSISLVFGRNLVAQSGNYLYSGSEISTLLNRTLLLFGGSYNYSGVSASLDYTVAPTGYSLSLAVGSYSYSGSTATLNYSAGSTNYSVALGSGNYSYSGAIASLAYVQGSAEYLLSLSTGNYSYMSGNAALTFTQGATDNTLELVGGNYSYLGGILELTYTANSGAYALSMLGGSYLYAGSNAVLLKVSSSDFKVILQVSSAITLQQNILSDISTALNISSTCTTAINLISAIESIESGG